MSKNQYIPSMADDAVKAKTGKDWKGWFSALDKAGAAKLTHKAIAELVHEKHGVPGWWSQMVTVEYERARGLRDKHQTSDGFSVSASKTIAASLADLYEASANAAKRKKWFPKGAFKASSATKDKYLNGAWKDGRLNIGFYAKGENKSLIAIQVSKLAKKSDVEDERKAWKAALTKLAALLES